MARLWPVFTVIASLAVVLVASLCSADQNQEPGWLAKIFNWKPEEPIDCTDEELRKSYALKLTQLHGDKYHKFKNDVFFPYLRDCGLEDGYKQALSDNEIYVRSKLDPPFGNFLLKQLYSFERIDAMQVVDKLTSMRHIDESNCNEEYVDEIESIYVKTYHEGLTRLRWCVEKGLARQLKACEGRFKLVGEKFVRDHPEEWSRIQLFTSACEKLLHERSLIRGVNLTRADLSDFLLSFELRGWTNKKNGLEITDLEKDLKQPCRVFFDNLKPSVRTIDLISARQDDEMMRFLIAFDYCGNLLLDKSHKPVSFKKKLELFEKEKYERIELYQPPKRSDN